MSKIVVVLALLFTSQTVQAQAWFETLTGLSTGSIAANYEASMRGETQYSIEQILNQPDDFKVLNSDGDNLLVAAIKLGFWNDLADIVKAGFKIDAKDKNGKIPLHHLVETWVNLDKEIIYADISLKAVHTLPVHEAELLTQDKLGNTPLSLWFTKPNTDFEYRAEIDHENGRNRLQIVGPNQRSFFSAPKVWEDGMKTSLFGLPYAVKDLSKPLQITKAKKSSLFEYVYDRFANNKNNFNDRYILDLYLSIDQTQERKSKFSNNVVQKLYEEDHYRVDFQSDNDLNSNTELYKTVSKWINEKTDNLTNDQKINILVFFHFYDSLKEILTYSGMTNQMLKDRSLFFDQYSLEKSFGVFERNIDGSPYTFDKIKGTDNEIVLFSARDSENSDKENIFSYSISNVTPPSENTLVMPIFDSKGDFSVSNIAIFRLRQVNVYDNQLRVHSSAIVGQDGRNLYILDLETKQLRTFTGLSEIPAILLKIKGQFYLRGNTGFRVDSTFYQYGTQRNGNLYQRSGDLVSWETRSDGLQNIKIGNRVIEGAEVFSTRGFRLFYKIKNTFNFIDFFGHVEGLASVDDIRSIEVNNSYESYTTYRVNGIEKTSGLFPFERENTGTNSVQNTEPAALATINGVQVYSNRPIPNELLSIAHQTIPRDAPIKSIVEYKPGVFYIRFDRESYAESHCYYELKTGQKLATTIVNGIPLTYAFDSVEKVVLDGSRGPLIVKNQGKYFTYAGNQSSIVLVNKDKSLYYFIDSDKFLEAKTGRIFGDHKNGGGPYIFNSTAGKNLKTLKEKIPNWTLVGED